MCSLNKAEETVPVNGSAAVEPHLAQLAEQLQALQIEADAFLDTRCKRESPTAFGNGECGPVHSLTSSNGGKTVPQPGGAPHAHQDLSGGDVTDEESAGASTVEAPEVRVAFSDKFDPRELDIDWGLGRSINRKGESQCAAHQTHPETGYLPDASVKVMQAWFLDHFSDPYPSVDDKSRLMAETHLTEKQVSDPRSRATRSRCSCRTGSLTSASASGGRCSTPYSRRMDV